MRGYRERAHELKLKLATGPSLACVAVNVTRDGEDAGGEDVGGGTDAGGEDVGGGTDAGGEDDEDFTSQFLMDSGEGIESEERRADEVEICIALINALLRLFC